MISSGPIVRGSRSLKYEKAEFYYQQVTDHYKTKKRSGTSGLADIKLAETIIRGEKREKFREIYRLITEDFEKTGGQLTFNADRFYYACVLAELADRLDRKNEAIQFADKALEIAKITEPQFSRHKDVGLVNTDKETLDKLKQIKMG